MTTTTLAADLVDRITEASAQLAAHAERQGISRAETAVALAAQVAHAATANAEVEKAKEQLNEDLAEYRADTGAYTASGGEVRERFLGYLDRLAALADEVTEFTGQAGALDARGQGLVLTARSLGVDVGVMPSVAEAMVQLLLHDPNDGRPLAGLFLSSRRGRAATVASLAELTLRLRPEGR
jgi:hypothetical protein